MVHISGLGGSWTTRQKLAGQRVGFASMRETSLPFWLKRGQASSCVTANCVVSGNSNFLLVVSFFTADCVDWPNLENQAQRT